MDNMLKWLDEEENQNWIKNVRHELHQYPELDFDLPVTIKLISKFLDESNVEYEKLLDNTAIVGEIKGKDTSTTIAIRADIDALPINEKSNCKFLSKHSGKMHACGHDAHAAILIGIIKALSLYKKELPCNFRFIFQPAEETTGGALPLIANGALDGVNYIYGLHVDPAEDCGTIGIKYGPMYASSTDIVIDIHGKSTHGAYPSLGVDAIVVSSYIVTAIQSIVSRNTDARDSLVLSFGIINGGTKENIIAQDVTIVGTMRTLSEKIKEYSKVRIEELVKNVAIGYGATGNVEFSDGYISLINYKECVDIIRENGIKLLGENSVKEISMPNMGVEDFAYYVANIPGAFFHLGVRNISKGIVAPLHSENFDIDEDALSIGVKLGIMNIFETYSKLIEGKE